jgi:signal transduction histidine kinase
MNSKVATESQLAFFIEARKDYPQADEPLKAFDLTVLRALLNSGYDSYAHLFQHQVFQPGEIIIRENDAGDFLCIISSGSVVSYKGDINNPVILGYRSRGEMIGEMALLDHRPRSASVMALEPTELLITDQAGFSALLSKPPFIGLNLLEHLTSRLRESDDMRGHSARVQRKLVSQLSDLESEKRHLLELQRLRQEMTDLIVHDLRNPLGSLTFSIKTLQMLLPEAAVEANHELFNLALSAAGRMQRLIDSMLEVSRMESGETELVRSQVEIQSFLNNIIQNVVLIQQHNFVFDMCLEPNLPIVSMDRDKIERVVSNLLDNALKHTPINGHIQISARVMHNELAIGIYNDGVLIPAEDREYIFERFAQVSGEKRRQRGFGLGLVYCRLTVSAHGGRIWVEPSADGRGNRFLFTLPV